MGRTCFDRVGRKSGTNNIFLGLISNMHNKFEQNTWETFQVIAPTKVKLSTQLWKIYQPFWIFFSHYGKSFYCTPLSFSYHILSPILNDEWPAILTVCLTVVDGPKWKLAFWYPVSQLSTDCHKILQPLLSSNLAATLKILRNSIQYFINRHLLHIKWSNFGTIQYFFTKFSGLMPND